MNLHDGLELLFQGFAVSGVVALGWQIFEKWDAQRNRLAVSTTSSGDHALSLTVSYRPAAHHVGYIAHAKVIGSSDSLVAGTERSKGTQSLRDAIMVATQQLSAERQAEARLLRFEGDPDGVYLAEFYVYAPTTPPSATIEISVTTTAFGRRLVRRTFPVSAAD